MPVITTGIAGGLISPKRAFLLVSLKEILGKLSCQDSSSIPVEIISMKTLFNLQLCVALLPLRYPTMIYSEYLGGIAKHM